MFKEAIEVKGEMALSTGDLNKYLPAVIKAETILGWMQPHEKIKNGYYWRVRDQVPEICRRMEGQIALVKAQCES